MPNERILAWQNCLRNYNAEVPSPESFECVRKAVPKMVSIVVAMLVILVIAVGTVGLVLVGIEGRGRHRVPKLAQQAARAARYVNGDASRR